MEQHSDLLWKANKLARTIGHDNAPWHHIGDHSSLIAKHQSTIHMHISGLHMWLLVQNMEDQDALIYVRNETETADAMV